MDTTKQTPHKHNKLYLTLIICLLAFLGSISLLLISFNSLIARHDQTLSGEICILISEKMNNAITSMTMTTQSVASIFSEQNYSSPYAAYKSIDKNDYIKFASIGFIDEDLNVYGSETEIQEFEKWQLLATAQAANPVSISIPYRSAEMGVPVITMFSQFRYNDNHQGWIFITYTFNELQAIARTNSMLNEIEISLVNGQSANVIMCSSIDERTVGSWTNAYLSILNFKTSEGKEQYTKWLKRMNSGEPDIGINYSSGNVIYTIHCTQIESMPGWYVVVRIPSESLSNTMNTFRNYVLIFVFALLVIFVTVLIGMYISNKKENATLEDLSAHDPLTDLLNRRAFDAAAEEMVSMGKELALIFFDIDFFKHINDQYGHDIGDKILVDFSYALAENFRNRAIIGRFGGDEFVILTRIDSKEELANILDTTLSDVRSIKIPNSKKHISVSAGIATYPEHADNLSSLKKCADSALYQAKEAGRNEYRWYKKFE